MKLETVRLALIGAGISSRDIVRRFTEAGEEIGVRVGKSVIAELIPIDDAQDAACGRGLAAAAKKLGYTRGGE